MSENRIKIIGVHSIMAEEPVHLIEVEILSEIVNFDFGQVTQEMPNLPKDNWQVAYDEIELESSISRKKFAFFFHYLDLSQPLSTPFGKLDLPKPSPIPEHLKQIEYWAP